MERSKLESTGMDRSKLEPTGMEWSKLERTFDELEWQMGLVEWW